MQGITDDLRTGHWYCDLHHSMLVIMFERLVPALREGRTRVVTYFIDNLTVYWLVHCLMEEEGFAHAYGRDLADQALIDRHAAAHFHLMERWRDQVFRPFKSGPYDFTALAEVADGFYRSVLHHIATADQETYGRGSTHDSDTRRSEIAHLATVGLPLSPYMAGALDTARHLAPDMVGVLDQRNIRENARAASPRFLDGGPTKGLRRQLTQVLERAETVLAPTSAPLARLGQEMLRSA